MSKCTLQVLMIFVQNEIFLSVLIDTFLTLPPISSVMHRIRQLGTGASESVVKVCKVGWNSYFMFCEMFSIWLISLVFCCSKYYILRPQIRFKVVFSVKFSGSGTESAVCHSSAQLPPLCLTFTFFPSKKKEKSKVFTVLRSHKKCPWYWRELARLS